MTVAARIGMSLTLNQMMDSMMAGVEKTGVLLLILQFAAMLLTGPCISKANFVEVAGTQRTRTMVMLSLKEGRLGLGVSLQCSLLLTGSMKGLLSPTTF